ncbi:MAG TPA: BTAD domain-containing putative transcriptional regulator [Gaiellaceae bacterium]|nr:BTAD domain-containing putative transcriptional regulator [Gaiellaceae bacterium]
MADGGRRFEFVLLGPIEVRAEGQPVPLGRRLRALLALLLVEPGRVVSAPMLAEELWAGAPPPGAETTLRSYVSRLRRALGGAAIVSEPGGYAAAVAADAVDAVRFERLLRDGRVALERDDAAGAAELLGSALALWRGAALEDVAEYGRLAAEARRLDELRLACLEERFEAELALGRHGELVPELRALVEREPLRERLRRQLVLALYHSGRQADALAEHREARRALDALGIVPGAELRELETAILRQELAVVRPAAERPELPLQTTSFVGRDAELAELEALLRGHRLVTLTGLGGSGKTRLALELARRHEGDRQHGVRLVDLTAVADPSLVGAAVAQALDADAASVDAAVERARRLDALLVLDNCEHVVGACAEIVDRLLRCCPQLRVLATSRVSLAVAGEIDYALEPLSAADAVDLFVQRAGALRRDLAADDPTIAAICRELDCMPLAIELAAARAKTLSPGEIAARLDDRFRFLRAWHRLADPRHRTLQTTMDWSYDLLGADEQRFLRRLAVFAGGAELDAAAAVCADRDDGAALDLLTLLVDASLVRVENGAHTRYRLLETVRQYAAARLAEDADVDVVRRRHAEHFLEVAESANLSIESLGRGPQRQEVVLGDQHNLRAAIDWASGEDVELALRLMLALENFWITHALAEGRRRYEQLLPVATDLPLELRARAMRDYASCLDVLQRPDLARSAYERSRELYAEAGDELGVANLDYRLGINVMQVDGDVERVRRLWEASLEVTRRLDDEVGELQLLGDLGYLEVRFGDVERGERLADESIAGARRLGWHWWVAQNLAKLSAWAVEAGRLDEAERRARDCLPVAERMGHGQFVLLALAVLARTAAARGDDERAVALWSSVAAVEDAPGRFGRFDRARYASAMPAAPLPPPLPLPEAVALALADETPRHPTGTQTIASPMRDAGT